jgi:hypothetical protein
MAGYLKPSTNAAIKQAGANILIVGMSTSLVKRITNIPSFIRVFVCIQFVDGFLLGKYSSNGTLTNKVKTVRLLL